MYLRAISFTFRVVGNAIYQWHLLFKVELIPWRIKIQYVSIPTDINKNVAIDLNRGGSKLYIIT